MRTIFYSLIVFLILSACSGEVDTNQVIYFDKFPRQTRSDAKLFRPDVLLGDIKDVHIISNGLLTENSRTSDYLISIFSIADLKFKNHFLPVGGGPNEALNVGNIRAVGPSIIGFKSTNKYYHVKYDTRQYALRIDTSFNLKPRYSIFSHEFVLRDGCCLYGWDVEQTSSEELLKYDFLDMEYSGFGQYYPEVGVSVPDSRKVSLFQKSIVVKPDLKRFALIYTLFDRFRIYNENGEIIVDMVNEADPKPPKRYMTSKGYDLPRPILDSAYTYHLTAKTSNNYIYIPYYGKEAFWRSKETGYYSANKIQVFSWDGAPHTEIILDKLITKFDIDPNDNYIIGYSGSDPDVFYRFDL